MKPQLPSSNPYEESLGTDPDSVAEEMKILQNSSRRNISKNPINFAIDSTEDEFKPSKFSRLAQFVIDELRKSYNIDPTGENYTVVIAASHDKGQSFKIRADSTDNQKYDGIELWSQKMVEKEVRAMKLNETKLIEQARGQLKEEDGAAPQSR